MDDNLTAAAAPETPGFALNIVHHGGFSENGGVVGNDQTWPQGFAKSSLLTEDELRAAAPPAMRRQRSPADIASTHAPGHPGGSPLNAGHPNPAVGGVTRPPPIMVAGPGPGLVAGPIPAAIGPHPVAGAIG